VVLGFGLSCAACAGGQTGEGPPESGKNDDGCDETILEIDVDDETALGFAPRRLLELASGPHTAPLHWLANEDFSFGPEEGVGSVTLEVTSTEAPPRYADSEPKEGESGVDCRDWIELDVMLSVQSAGGALDESVLVTLIATDAYVTRFDASIDPEMLGGTFAFDEGSLDGVTLEELSLQGIFSQYGTSGTFGSRVKASSGKVASESRDTLASWPTTLEELCDRGNTPTVSRDGGEASIQAGLDLLAAATGLVLRGPNDEVVTVELGAIDDGGPACLAAPNAIFPEGSVGNEVVLSISTADGAVEHDYLGFIHVAAASDGSLGEARIIANCNAYPTVEYPGECGDWGVDLMDYIGVNMHVEITLRPPTDAPEVEGTFTLDGVPPCPEGESCDDDPVDLAVFSLERE
jgi:hypothetical protein